MPRPKLECPDLIASSLQCVDWTSTILNTAQVLSAIATAASVWVALWLARRSESQRLRFYIEERRLIVVGPEPRTAAQAISTYMKVTIVNAGVLPAHIQLVLLYVQTARKTKWMASADPVYGIALPAILNHGEQAAFTIPLSEDQFPTGSMLSWWWWLRSAFVEVKTSLGSKKVRLRWKDIRWIRRRVLFVRTERAEFLQ